MRFSAGTTFHADPLYNQGQNDPHDIAVVVLESPVRGIAPARLATADSLSGLAAGQTFTSVGYGAYEVTNGPGSHDYLYNDVRMRSTGSLNAVTKSWLRISGNPATVVRAGVQGTTARRGFATADRSLYRAAPGQRGPDSGVKPEWAPDRCSPWPTRAASRRRRHRPTGTARGPPRAPGRSP
jgi:hypothetical protein